MFPKGVLMKTFLALIFTTLSLNSFAVSPSDKYTISYIDMLSLKLAIYNPTNARFRNIERLYFDVQKPSSIVVEIEYSGSLLTEEALTEMKEFYMEAVKEEAEDLNIKGLSVKIDVKHLPPEEKKQ